MSFTRWAARLEITKFKKLRETKASQIAKAFHPASIIFGKVQSWIQAAAFFKPAIKYIYQI